MTAGSRSGASRLATPATYKNIIVDVTNGFAGALRADRLALVIRQVASRRGRWTPAHHHGNHGRTRIDNHIVACRLTPERPAVRIRRAPDAVRPIYAVDTAKGATFVAQKLAGTSNSCSTAGGAPVNLPKIRVSSGLGGSGLFPRTVASRGSRDIGRR